MQPILSRVFKKMILSDIKILPFIVDILKCKRKEKRKNPIIGIYKITSPSGKIYIGQSSDIENRFAKHYKKNKCKTQTYLYHSFKKYGVENHLFEIIHLCYYVNELDYWEIYYANVFKVNDKKSGLNLKECGKRGSHSKESKEKMSKAQLGKTWSEERKKEHSKLLKSLYASGELIPPNTNKKASEETRDKMSKARSGEKHPMYGKGYLYEGEKNPFYNKKHTEETLKILRERPRTEDEKNKISLSKIGKKSSEETKLKQSKARLGKKESDETKRRKSESLKGKYVGEKHPQYGKKQSQERISKRVKKNTGKKRTPEQRKKMSDSHIGKNLPEEQKQKISNTYWSKSKEERAEIYSKRKKKTKDEQSIIQKKRISTLKGKSKEEKEATAQKKRDTRKKNNELKAKK